MCLNGNRNWNLENQQLQMMLTHVASYQYFPVLIDSETETFY